MAMVAVHATMGEGQTVTRYYTAEKHTRILIALLKFHGIRRIIASPGMTCVCLIGSLQSDPFFTIYSSVDERSAAFIACGMAAESQEPVALICTGSTASRNYVPGLTEAFYRHLPVLAITTTQHLGRVGNLNEQVIDRSQRMSDLVKTSVIVDIVHSEEDEWQRGIDINRAILALTTNGGGPSHVNLVTTYDRDFSYRTLPAVKGVRYSESLERVPSIKPGKKVAVLVGVHDRWSERLTLAVDAFCRKFDAVVFCTHASNYVGAHGVNMAFYKGLRHSIDVVPMPDLIIHIGGVVRCIPVFHKGNAWRVSPDGRIVDPTRRLTHVFQMGEVDFFERYADDVEDCANQELNETGYAWQWQEFHHAVQAKAKVTDLPFSNVWIAQQTIGRLPDGCVLHIAGSNTAYTWNLFDAPFGIECYSNDGTMGIDGQVSALIGESLVAPDRLHLGVCGDLTLFYDMNSLGNRHVGRNVRLMVINNGLGAMFKIYSATAADFGDMTDPYMAAAGHFGNKSPDLLRHYARDLGFEYLSAHTKKEFSEHVGRFLDPNITEKPMLFEVFTDAQDESDARYVMNHLEAGGGQAAKETARDMIRFVAGERGVSAVKKILGR